MRKIALLALAIAGVSSPAFAQTSPNPAGGVPAPLITRDTIQRNIQAMSVEEVGYSTPEYPSDSPRYGYRVPYAYYPPAYGYYPPAYGYYPPYLYYRPYFATQWFDVYDRPYFATPWLPLP